MAPSNRVKMRAPFPSFSSISIVTLAILSLLSIVSAAALPGISSRGFLEKHDSSGFSRRDETDPSTNDPPPTYEALDSSEPPPSYGSAVHRNNDLWNKLAQMTTLYPLVRKGPSESNEVEVKWTYGKGKDEKVLKIQKRQQEIDIQQNARYAIRKLANKKQAWQTGERFSVKGIEPRAGLLWSTLLDKSEGSKFILDMDLIYTEDRPPKWWTAAPTRSQLSGVLSNKVPFVNRVLRTPDVIEGMAHMDNLGFSYFGLNTASVSVTVAYTNVPQKFKKDSLWIEKLQLSQFRLSSDITRYEISPDLNLPILNYYRSPEMVNANHRSASANDVWTTAVFILDFLLGPSQQQSIKNVCSQLQQDPGSPESTLETLQCQGWDLPDNILKLLSECLAVEGRRISIHQLKEKWSKLPEYLAAKALK